MLVVASGESEQATRMSTTLAISPVEFHGQDHDKLHLTGKTKCLFAKKQMKLR